MGWYQRRVHGGPDTECSGPPTLVPKMPKVSRERSGSAFMAWMKEGANTSKDGSVKVHCRNGVFICNCSCTCIAHMRCICKADMPLDAPQTTRPLEGCTCWKLCNCGRTMSFEPPYDSVVRIPRDVFDRLRVPWRGKLNFRNGFHFGTLPDIETCDVRLLKYQQALSDFKKTGNQEDLQWPRCDSCISLGTAVAVCSPLPGRGGKDKHTCFRYTTPSDVELRAWLKKCRKEERRRRRKARAVV